MNNPAANIIGTVIVVALGMYAFFPQTMGKTVHTHLNEFLAGWHQVETFRP